MACRYAPITNASPDAVARRLSGQRIAIVPAGLHALLGLARVDPRVDDPQAADDQEGDDGEDDEVRPAPAALRDAIPQLDHAPPRAECRGVKTAPRATRHRPGPNAWRRNSF
jgi:hypothetical protein